MYISVCSQAVVLEGAVSSENLKIRTHQWFQGGFRIS